MVDVVKAKVEANPVSFDPTAYKGLNDEKALVAAAGKLAEGAVTDTAVWMALSAMAVRSGEIDKASGKVNSPRSVQPMLVAFRTKFGALPGRKPYADTTLAPMTTAFNHFAAAGFMGAFDAAKYAAENFKGAFTSRGSKLGKLLAAPRDGAVPTTAEAKAFDESDKAEKASVSKALGALLKAFDKVDKEHATTLKAQPSNRARFLVARSNVAALIAMVRDETDGQSAEDELAEIQRKLAAPVSNGVAA